MEQTVNGIVRQDIIKNKWHMIKRKQGIKDDECNQRLDEETKNPPKLVFIELAVIKQLWYRNHQERRCDHIDEYHLQHVC